MKRAAAVLTFLLLSVLPSTAQGTRPNIIVIMLDDATKESMAGKAQNGQPFMPFLESKLSSARIFTNTIHAQALCCPSRTTMLTGMYPHNHGVTNNSAPNGGYWRYMKNRLAERSWPKLLKGTYHTVLLGKFLNRYPDPKLPVRPAGWSYWFATYAQGFTQMFNWRAINNDGEQLTIAGPTDRHYQTDFLANRAVDIINRKIAKRPIAMLLSPATPHIPHVAALRHQGIYDTEPFQPGLKPSFNEADVSDKPSYLRLQTPSLTADQINMLTAQWRVYQATMLSIDDMLATVWAALEANNQLANTYLFVVSDNGLMFGEHRSFRKNVPYREATRAITYAWGPGVAPGIDVRLVSNLDFLPTFMEMAGKPIPSYADGRSLLPLLRGSRPQWRKALLVQGYPPDDDEGGTLDTKGQSFFSLVTRFWTFTDYDGEREFYDLKTDPHELTNTAGSLPPAFVQAAQDRLDALYSCAGLACHQIENAELPVH